MVVSEGGMARAVRGVGRIRFQLEYGGLQEVDGVLFVPGLRFNLLSVSALEDVGYSTLFKRGHVFIYREGVDLVEPQFIGDQMDRLYKLRGQPTGYDSESDEEQEAPETAVGPRIQSCIPREERESLLSTDKRLNWCDRTSSKWEDGLSEELRVQSSFQEDVFWFEFYAGVGLALGSEGAPTANNVMGPDDGDDRSTSLAKREC
jgi:hypothetical protein